MSLSAMLDFMKPGKDELRTQVANVTIEIQQLQQKAQDLRDIFSELENVHTEAEACCFPFSYIMLRDMVTDASLMSGDLQQKWYGSTDQSGGSKRSRGGGIRRLLENCRALAERMTQFELIVNELKQLSHKELQKTLDDRQASLAQEKLIFSQLDDLLKRLQDLGSRSSDMCLCARYRLFRSGVADILASFRTVSGLSSNLPSSSTSQPTNR